MKKLVVIPCGGAKLDKPASAAELYIGSMFKDTLRTARAMADDADIRILSAKHGLVKLDQIIEPYDVKMGDADSISHSKLQQQITELHEDYDVFDYRIEALLPKAYYSALWAAVHTGKHRHVFNIWNRFDGCAGIGYQKAVLKTIRAEVAA